MLSDAYVAILVDILGDSGIRAYKKTKTMPGRRNTGLTHTLTSLPPCRSTQRGRIAVTLVKLEGLDLTSTLFLDVFPSPESNSKCYARWAHE